MQLPEEIRKSVFFIQCRTNEGFRMAGTGFFISSASETPEIFFIDLVTAKHVIIGAVTDSIDGKVWLRINTQDGYENISTNLESWYFNEEDTSVDAAILSDTPDLSTHDFTTIPIDMVADQNTIAEHSIGIGAEVFLTGLFVNHHGKKRNNPIVRVGNIAAMPEEPIFTGYPFGDIEAYLIESRSIGGLSGSPVFVYLRGLKVVNNTIEMKRDSFFWLGLMHGHWELPSTKQDTVVEDKVSKEAINMGIGIVVPATKILELYYSPSQIALRDSQHKQYKKNYEEIEIQETKNNVEKRYINPRSNLVETL